MNEIVVSNQNTFISPVADLQTARMTYQAMKEFVTGIMQEGIDFGPIPGTGQKPTLLKPGAEKLLRFFGMTIQMVEMEKYGLS